MDMNDSAQAIQPKIPIGEQVTNISWKAFAPIAVAILLALIPPPAGLQQFAWWYFAIFAGVIVGLMFEPLPGERGHRRRAGHAPANRIREKGRAHDHGCRTLASPGTAGSPMSARRDASVVGREQPHVPPSNAT